MAIMSTMPITVGGTAGVLVGSQMLPTVAEPDKAYADITRQEYDDMVKNYRQFELDTIEKAQTDTSLIDQARLDAPMAAAMTKEIQERNLSRYGGQLTGAQQQQLDASLTRGTTLGGIQAVNDARIAQDEANKKLLSDLINIGQGVNRSSQTQLAASAQNATQLKNAYTQAKAASKANTINTVASLGTAAILAFAI